MATGGVEVVDEGTRGGSGYPRWKGGPDLKQNKNRLEIADGSFSSQ